MRARRVRDRGTVARRHEADALLEQTGDCVLVRRDSLRSFVMVCPDGCGDTLTINLDPRTAKAWRFYRKRNQISLFPSVWRDTGCGSHFIVWNHTIVWCGPNVDDKEAITDDVLSLRQRVLRVVSYDWQHFTELAEKIEEVPWDVYRVCKDLARKSGPLTEGTNRFEGFFKRLDPSHRNGNGRA